MDKYVYVCSSFPFSCTHVSKDRFASRYHSSIFWISFASNHSPIMFRTSETFQPVCLGPLPHFIKSMIYLVLEKNRERLELRSRETATWFAPHYWLLPWVRRLIESGTFPEPSRRYRLGYRQMKETARQSTSTANIVNSTFFSLSLFRFLFFYFFFLDREKRLARRLTVFQCLPVGARQLLSVFSETNRICRSWSHMRYTCC